MSGPYVPTLFDTPIWNPSVGATDPPAIPYVSPSMFRYAPTALDVAHLVPGGSVPENSQALADELLRASKWADDHCFGSDPSGNGVSLAAGMCIESVTTKFKTGGLRLVCSYKPILQVLGVDVGLSPAQLGSVGSAIASGISIGIRTIYVPFWGVPFRPPGDWAPGPFGGVPGGGVYVVWSYVVGFPHTMLTANVAQGATSCVVASTDGNGGVWGVVPGSTYFRCYDDANTESVKVISIATSTPDAEHTTFTTSPFANAHTVPTAPDFLPFTTLPDTITQAVIFKAMGLVRARGAKALVMPSTAGGKAQTQAFAQAGAGLDLKLAEKMLRPYMVHVRSKV